jgi:hypothetical protein
MPDVRFGSKADIRAAKGHVRFTPDFDAKFGNLFLYADNSFRIAAQKNAPPAYAERWRKRPVLMVGDNPHNPLDRLAANKSVINIPDLMTEPGYIDRDPRFVALVEAQFVE